MFPEFARPGKMREWDFRRRTPASARIRSRVEVPALPPGNRAASGEKPPITRFAPGESRGRRNKRTRLGVAAKEAVQKIWLLVVLHERIPIFYVDQTPVHRRVDISVVPRLRVAVHENDDPHAVPVLSARFRPVTRRHSLEIRV